MKPITHRLPCAWLRPNRFMVPTQVDARLLPHPIGARRIVLLGPANEESGGGPALRLSPAGVKTSPRFVVAGGSGSHRVAAVAGSVASLRGHGKFKATSRSTSGDHNLLRPARTGGRRASDLMPCPMIAISITRTTRLLPDAGARQAKGRTVLHKSICPGGQRPDRLRARPSDEVKFSVSSPRSRNSTVPRSRPRYFDL